MRPARPHAHSKIGADDSGRSERTELTDNDVKTEKTEEAERLKLI